MNPQFKNRKPNERTLNNNCSAAHTHTHIMCSIELFIQTRWYGFSPSLVDLSLCDICANFFFSFGFDFLSIEMYKYTTSHRTQNHICNSYIFIRIRYPAYLTNMKVKLPSHSVFNEFHGEKNGEKHVCCQHHATPSMIINKNSLNTC